MKTVIKKPRVSKKAKTEQLVKDYEIRSAVSRTINHLFMLHTTVERLQSPIARYTPRAEVSMGKPMIIFDMEKEGLWVHWSTVQVMIRALAKAGVKNLSF